jgi:integrase/recombinase XerD
MRLKSASEQLVKLKVRKNQNPLRDRAIFLVLLNTGLRVSELLDLRRDQYTGKHFQNVKRKGKVRTAKIFVPTEAREGLDLYLSKERQDTHSEDTPNQPLLISQTGQSLARQHVDRLLEQLAAQANSRLADQEKISLSAHVLRHTFLRKLTQKSGVEFAMQAAGHSSSKYIWRYVKPGQEETERALEDLF